MKLNNVINGIEIEEIIGETDIDIKDIAYDSRKADKGCMFVCIDGIDDDGHKYLQAAVDKGAVCAVVTKDIKIEGVTIIKVKDSRYALARSSANLYDNPSKKLNLIGLTGTKGKTTITYMIRSVFDYDVKLCAVAGTLGFTIGEDHIKTNTTTPQSYDLQRFFYNALNQGAHTAVMEVSSMGLKLDRVACSDYDIGVFTNISRAHIGNREHRDFQDYIDSKSKLFKMCKKGIVNIDDERAQYIMDRATCDIVTLSLEKEADIVAKDIKLGNSYSSFIYKGLGHEFEIVIKMPGKFNIYNALIAATSALMSGVGIEAIQKGLKDTKVPGRCEKVKTDTDYTVMIDYAHTPDSLEKLLAAMKEFSKGRVIPVFGCGGDRDNKMRPMMGEIAGNIADFSIITSDNPRTEDPDRIIGQIEEGIKKTTGQYVCITDRTDAIRYAMENAQKNDLIILAGKGHETYIDQNGSKRHYDEREVVADLLKDIYGDI